MSTAESAESTADERFRTLVTSVEPSLRRALVAAYGPEIGREATADALAWAWSNLDRVTTMHNPGGYLFRVGQSASRRERRWRAQRSPWPVPEHPAMHEGAAIEPRLTAAIGRLSPRQRAAVLLVHGHDFTLDDAAASMGCSVSSVRVHLRRGLQKLRADLGVEDR